MARRTDTERKTAFHREGSGITLRTEQLIESDARGLFLIVANVCETRMKGCSAAFD